MDVWGDFSKFSSYDPPSFIASQTQRHTSFSACSIISQENGSMALTVHYLLDFLSIVGFHKPVMWYLLLFKRLFIREDLSC